MSNEIARLTLLRAITPPPELNPERWAEVAIDSFFPEEETELPFQITSSGLAVLEDVDVTNLSEQVAQTTDEEPGYSVWRSLKQTRRHLTIGRDALLTSSKMKPREIPELRALTRGLGQINDLHQEGLDVTEAAGYLLVAIGSFVLPQEVIPASIGRVRTQATKNIKMDVLTADIDLEDTETYHKARKRFRNVVNNASLSMLTLDLTDERAQLLAEGQLLSKRFGQKHGQALREARSLGLIN